MSSKTELQKIGEETMRFMRGKYLSDEIGNGVDELKFINCEEEFVTINIRDGFYEFTIDIPKGKSKVSVADLETLEIVKQIILKNKKPDRKPFSKENALYSDCGHRCDLCVHYRGGTISEGFRRELKERLQRVYEEGTSGDSAHWGEDMRLCDGCVNGGYDGEHNPCGQKKCAGGKGVDRCMDCGAYPCDSATAGYSCGIEARSILADDVTWAILPYVAGQYGN